MKIIPHTYESTQCDYSPLSLSPIASASSTSCVKREGLPQARTRTPATLILTYITSDYISEDDEMLFFT